MAFPDGIALGLAAAARGLESCGYVPSEPVPPLVHSSSSRKCIGEGGRICMSQLFSATGDVGGQAPEEARG